MKKTIKMLLIMLIAVIGINGVSANKCTCSCDSMDNWKLVDRKKVIAWSGVECNEEKGEKIIIHDQGLTKSTYVCGCPVENNIQVDTFDADYGLYCKYKKDNIEYYFLYSGGSKEDLFYLDQNFNGGWIKEDGTTEVPWIADIESGRPFKNVTNQEEIDWLKSNGLLNNNGDFTCPTNPFGTDLGAPTKYACGASGCHIYDIPTIDESYSCNYIGQTSGKSITINYENSKWTITYPDGNSKVLSGAQINGNFMPGKDCNDIYYDMNNKTIRVVLDSNVSNNLTLSGLCEKYDGNINRIEHFCSGECSYPEMVCSSNYDYNEVNCGNLDGIPAALPVFIRNIINIVKIAVPIILVIMGMLDFAKAVTSNDEKGMKEAQNKFVKRIIAGVAVFLVITIVQFVFRVINTDDTNYMASCIDCFINGRCGTEYDICKNEVRESCASYCSNTTGNTSSGYNACVTACESANSITCDNLKK